MNEKLEKNKFFDINKLPPELEEDRKRGLESIRNVGTEKPMGYIPIDTVSSYFRTTVEDEVAIAERKGLQHLVLLPGETDVGLDGALYVWDESSLSQLLQENADILTQENWPQTSEAFVRRVATEYVPENKPVHEIIKKAFGEKS